MKTIQQTNIFIKRLFLSLFLSTALMYQAIATASVIQNVSNANLTALRESIDQYKSEEKNCDPNGRRWLKEPIHSIEQFEKSNGAIATATTLGTELSKHGEFKQDFIVLLNTNLGTRQHTAGDTYVFQAITSIDAPYPEPKIWFDSMDQCRNIMKLNGEVVFGLAKINARITSYWVMILFVSNANAYVPHERELELATEQPPVEDKPLGLKRSISSSQLP